MLIAPFITEEGSLIRFRVFFSKFLSPRLWGLGCLSGGLNAGLAWNSLVLANLVGF